MPSIDAVVGRIQRLESRRRLADATAGYFKNLTPAEAAEERALAKDLSTAAGAIDFDLNRAIDPDAPYKG
jgi:hypothetical protein